MAVDPGVQRALDAHALPWEGVTTRAMFGGVAYMVGGKMFAMLAEGVVAMKLPDPLRSRALAHGGRLALHPQSGKRLSGHWVQFLVLLEDDVGVLIPWLEAAREYVASLPSPAGRRRSPRASE